MISVQHHLIVCQATWSVRPFPFRQAASIDDALHGAQWEILTFVKWDYHLFSVGGIAPFLV